MQPTYTQESDFRRERDFGQKISATFEFIGGHWRPLGRVLLYLVAPAALLQGLVAGLVQSQLFGAVRQAAYHQSSSTTWAGRYSAYTTFSSPVYLLSNVASGIFSTMLILSVYGYLLRCLYPVAPGAPATVAEVWVIVRRQFVGTFFSLYGLGVIIGLSFLVLVVPGVYMIVALSLFFIVRMVEGTGFGTTINRCVRLTRGKWWSTFGLIIMMIVLLWMLLIGFGIITTLFSGSLKSLFLATRTLPTVALIAINLLSGLFTLLLYPPLLLALAFQYFNLVERHEGVGLHRLIDQLGQAPAAPPGATPYHPTEEGEY